MWKQDIGWDDLIEPGSQRDRWTVWASELPELSRLKSTSIRMPFYFRINPPMWTTFQWGLGMEDTICEDGIQGYSLGTNRYCNKVEHRPHRSWRDTKCWTMFQRMLPILTQSQVQYIRLMERYDSLLPQDIYDSVLGTRWWRHSQVPANNFWSTFIHQYFPSWQEPARFGPGGSDSRPTASAG